ncbi:unnamed protein product [Prorocentrum cordatum]|uniref:Uncharacterized protein n=1 Tax=Prorocentrum cordatum TaxID=2364126 RepID=A0ABN9YCY2_9DINO|nr:unnamed protein product [Polarella glacialis]
MQRPAALRPAAAPPLGAPRAWLAPPPALRGSRAAAARRRLASAAPLAAALLAARAAARRRRGRGGAAASAGGAGGSDQEREALRLPAPGAGVRLAAAAAYLLPLVDGVEFGVEFAQLPALSGVVSLIPFGTTVFLLLLPVVASNRELPRLLRFSVWQALVMEVVLQIPTLIAAAISLTLGGFEDADEMLTISGGDSTMDLGTFGDIDGPLDPPLWADSAIFLLLAATSFYGIAKALLGEEAEGVPIVSDVARAPTDSL